MSGLCLLIGALAGTHGLRVIAVADETFVLVFAQARRGLVLASSSVEEMADFGFSRRGVGDVITTKCGCSLGGTKELVDVCTVC